MKQKYENIIPLRFQKAEYEDIQSELREVIKKQIKGRDGLYLHGQPGTGKTYMACGIAKNLIKNNIKVMFLNTGEFLNRIREEFNVKFSGQPDVGIFREVMDFDGVIIFDDIGAEAVSDWVRERLYLIINKKYEDMLPMIFTSNCDREILSARLGDRITSRISEMSIIIKIDGEDLRK